MTDVKVTDNTSSAKQIPSLKIDVFYALVMLGSSTIWSIIGAWLLYFYLPPEGDGVMLVPAALYGIVMFLTRVINATLAPFIGYWSDNTRSRWGRRLPFMTISALPMLFFFILLWMPPVRNESIWNLVYLGVAFVLYNFFYSMNQIPYTALLPELALTDEHRVRISAWSSSFFLIGVIAGGLAGFFVERLGYATAALLYAGFALPLFYIPLLVLRERPERQLSREEASEKRLDFREGIVVMLRNKAFVVMTATGVFYWGLTALIQSVIPYIVTEVCLLDVSDTMTFYIPAIIASLACYPLITWLVGKVGKWRVFAGSLLTAAIVLPGLMLIGPWFPFSLKTQGIVWITLQAIATSGVMMLPPTFGAEIADHDAEVTGQRREGIYYAAWGVLDQVINGVVAGLLPVLLLLGRSHTDPNGPLGVRMVGVVGGLMMFAAFLIFQRYPFRHKQETVGVTE